MLRKKIKFNLNEIYEFILWIIFISKIFMKENYWLKTNFLIQKKKIWDTPALFRYLINLPDKNDKLIEKYIVNLINSKDLKNIFSKN